MRPLASPLLVHTQGSVVTNYENYSNIHSLNTIQIIKIVLVFVVVFIFLLLSAFHWFFGVWPFPEGLSEKIS